MDILLRMMRSFRTDYIQDVYLELFREYQCTTLNLRIFWIDTVGLQFQLTVLNYPVVSAKAKIKPQIITMDQEHSNYILSTGFGNFWRAQKERM